MAEEGLLGLQGLLQEDHEQEVEEGLLGLQPEDPDQQVAEEGLMEL